MHRLLALLVLALPLVAGVEEPRGTTVKVYVLAGQSNMEGYGKIRSLPTLAETDADLLARLRAPDGTWRERDDVVVHWTSHEPATGPLTVGWGAGADCVGPEIGFGAIVGDAHEDPVLLIKTAWGGKDVYCDFRSPSAGKPTKAEGALLRHQVANGRERERGAYFRRMVADVRETLDRVGELVPGATGYELCGFAWFQGWNDYCEWHLELDGHPVGRALIDRYHRNLQAMLKDLRKELGAPDLPIVVGELGVGGLAMDVRAKDRGDREANAVAAFRAQQRASVKRLRRAAFVPTAAFWDERLDELRKLEDDWPSDEAKAEYEARGGHWYCHYNGSAPNYARVGRALAEALLELER